jgi:hypothetical protein
MELEIVELRCLTYLQQTSSPVVPLSRLVAHLRQLDDCGEVEESALLDFLRGHDLFQIFDPMPIDANEARQLGISTDLRVVLATRVPTRAEAYAVMKETLAGMAQALETAIGNASQRHDPELRRKAEILLRRVKKFQEDLAALD